MTLENILGITDSAELARVEEQISKKKAAWLFESGRLDELDAGSFASLAEIHRVLFSDIYDFAGRLREVNISKGSFRLDVYKRQEQGDGSESEDRQCDCGYRR